MTNTGRATIYAGGAGGLSATPIFSATGESANDLFGAAVGTAGDVNGDGYGDVVVGAHGYMTNTGRAYAYHGSAGGLSATPIFTATGEGAVSQFGVSVSTAGDVNGDGYGDVVVGANAYNSRGRAYVYAGGAGGLSATPIFSATGGAGDNFGLTVGTAGDVNGDGYGDVIVTAIGFSSGSAQVYVYAGGPSGPFASPIFTATAEGCGILITAGAVGDVNGDGYGDVVVGAQECNDDQGRVTVYAGGPSGLSASPMFTATGEGTNNHFGAAVGAAGDVNGDGYADLVVGAFCCNECTQGRVYVYAGGPSGLSTSPIFTATEGMYNTFGWSAGTAGDVNGDGYADIVVGAPYHDSDRGRAYAYAGGPGGLSASPIFTASGENTGDFFGADMGTAGDVNGDGYADVVVGAYRYVTKTGRVYVYAGGLGGLSASPIFTATGEGTDNQFGISVGTAGDVNGDGAADLVVGADAYNSRYGRLYVYGGNGGAGRPVLARQARGDGSGTPVQPWGLAHAGRTFQVRLNATSPLGRSRVRLQVEACAPGVPFGSATCRIETAPAWTDVTTATGGVPLSLIVTEPPGPVLCRWRARVLYAPYWVTAAGVTPPPNPAHGPWRRLLGQALEADVRVTPYRVYLPLVLR